MSESQAIAIIVLASMSAFCAAVGVVVLIFKMGEWKKGVDKVGESLKGFDKWKGEADSDKASFKRFMKEVKDDIRSIRDHIAQIFQRMGMPLAEGASPLQLTDYGREISDLTAAKQIAKRLAEKLQRKVIGKADFEIQAFCEEYMEKEYKPTDDEDARIKKAAYEKAISRRRILSEVIMLELRDELMRIE